MNNKQKKTVYLLFSILLFVLIITISNRYSTQDITEHISKKGIYAPIIYILIQIVGQIFAPLSTSTLFVAGFILFKRKAILYLIIVWIITSITNFYISRIYGKKALKFFLGTKGIETVNSINRNLSKKKYYILRILTFYINDFASYAFGLTDISFLNYILSTIISMIPWSIIMLLVISEQDSILASILKLFGVMIPLSLLSYIILNKISIKRFIKGLLFKFQNR